MICVKGIARACSSGSTTESIPSFLKSVFPLFSISASVLRLPVVIGGVAHPILAAEIDDFGAGFAFPEHGNNPFLGVLSGFHESFWFLYYMICSPETGTKMKRFFRNAKILWKEQPDEKISIYLRTDRVCAEAS